MPDLKNARGESARNIHGSLKQRILSMDLMPGEPMDEQGLAKSFGVSRSPVREALLRLAAEGLVTSLPNKSTIVASLNVERFPPVRGCPGPCAAGRDPPCGAQVQAGGSRKNPPGPGRIRGDRATG